MRYSSASLAFSVVTLSLAAILYGSFILASPPIFCDNPCTGTYTTATDWAHGSSCSEAINNLLNKLHAAADSQCQSLGYTVACNRTFVQTGSCTYIGTPSQPLLYSVDGYMRHGCKYLFCS